MFSFYLAGSLIGLIIKLIEDRLIGENHIRLCAYRRPHKDNETKGQVGQLRLIYYFDLRNRIRTWSFKGQEGNSQDKKSRCLIIICLSNHTDRSFR